MNTKKGIELSFNFIVMLLIAIVIFGFGVRFIYTLSSQAIDLKDMTSQELDDRVADLLCSNSQKICISTDKKIIQKGKFDVFGVKVLNVGDEQTLELHITRPNPSAYTKQNTPIVNDVLEWSPDYRLMAFKQNEEHKFGIGIVVPPTALSGTYIFDVKVLKTNGDQYTSTQKMYVEVP